MRNRFHIVNQFFVVLSKTCSLCACMHVLVCVSAYSKMAIVLMKIIEYPSLSEASCFIAIVFTPWVTKSCATINMLRVKMVRTWVRCWVAVSMNWSCALLKFYVWCHFIVRHDIQQVLMYCGKNDQCCKSLVNTTKQWITKPGVFKNKCDFLSF